MSHLRRPGLLLAAVALGTAVVPRGADAWRYVNEAQLAPTRGLVVGVSRSF